MAEGIATMKLSAEKTKPVVDRLAGDEHVVSPDQKAQHRDGHAREGDDLVAEDALSREARNDLADHSHRRQNHDVNGRVRIEPEQMLEQQRVAAERRSKDADVEEALEGQKEDGDRQHRRAQHHDDAGGIHGPQEQRHAEPGHARGAHFVNRHDEIEAGENGGKAGDEDADRHGNDLRVRVRAAVGRVEGPAGVHAAVNHRIHREHPARHVDVPAQQVQPRKGQIARADHHGHQEISEDRGNRRNQEEENHDDAVHGEQLVVGFRLHQRALRIDQVDAHQNGEGAADEEEERDRNQVEKRDAFVIGGEQPGLPAVVRVQIIDAGSRGGGRLGAVVVVALMAFLLL